MYSGDAQRGVVGNLPPAKCGATVVATMTQDTVGLQYSFTDTIYNNLGD
jgi:hypothetical protein